MCLYLILLLIAGLARSMHATANEDAGAQCYKRGHEREECRRERYDTHSLLHPIACFITKPWQGLVAECMGRAAMLHPAGAQVRCVMAPCCMQGTEDLPLILL